VRQSTQLTAGSSETDAGAPGAEENRWTTPGGIPVVFEHSPSLNSAVTSDASSLRLHLEHARLSLLRGFDQLLCLEGLNGVEQLPHQVETVRKVLRHFHGRVLLADEVGLGKTIEACLLLREYLLRGLVRRALILVPPSLVSQWHAELREKFGLEFSVPGKSAAGERPEFWRENDRVLTSLALAKSPKRAALVAGTPWDLVIVDEAHHCKNRNTRNWQLINSLQRRHMFLLTATPVQNNLVELYNLLTLLEPGHLRTEGDFKRQYVRRGNPRDPRNRERLRSLLGEVMIRNTRSLVQMDLPPRYAQTLVAQPAPDEQLLYGRLDQYLRHRKPVATSSDEAGSAEDESPVAAVNGLEPAVPESAPEAPTQPSVDDNRAADSTTGDQDRAPLSRMQLAALLAAQGSHPSAVALALERAAQGDGNAAEIVRLAKAVPRSAKDERLLDIIHKSRDHKLLIFVNFRRTIHHLQELLTGDAVPFSTFSGKQTDREKDAAVEAFRETVPVMLCTDSGGEGRNLQFADTLVNYDLPWNPMRIEQRVGRVHRIGQTRDVFVFNLCTAGSLEARILDLLNDKIRMFELVVGEVGSILGNLNGGDEFESLVLKLWSQSRDGDELDQSFSDLGNSLLDAQERYLATKELDEALFGEDYE
jgi:SNF2 family DNA or RNA helicase